MTQYLSLLPFLGLVFIVSLSGRLYMPGEWYQTLSKPWFTPPGWVFAPVWAVMYTVIAVAGWLVWREQGFGLLLAVWFIQLGLNMAWSWLMFGLEDLTLALYDIIAMWLSIALFIVLAWSQVPTAAMLFVLYLVWVSFAAFLHYRIWQLNGAAT